MSTTDHPVSYYQHLDITDPTPYEHDSTVYEGTDCMICEDCFHEGERILRLVHRSLNHDRFWIHERCFQKRFGIVSDEVRDILDDLGFEVEEGDE